MILDSNQIMKIIPHRYPFLLVDKIIELEEGRRAVGEKAVSANEYYFAGHFPDMHVMPGVLIIEALAQVGTVAILSLEKNRGKYAFFAGIKNARFKRKVIPGDKLRLEVEVTKVKGSVGIGEARATVDGQLVCAAQLTFALGT